MRSVLQCPPPANGPRASPPASLLQNERPAAGNIGRVQRLHRYSGTACPDARAAAAHAGVATAVSCSSQPGLIATRTLPRVSRFAPPAGPARRSIRPAHEAVRAVCMYDVAGAALRPRDRRQPPAPGGQRSAKWMNGLQFVSREPRVKSPKFRPFRRLAGPRGRKCIHCKSLRVSGQRPSPPQSLGGNRTDQRPRLDGVQPRGSWVEQYSGRGEFMQQVTPGDAPRAAALLPHPRPAPASRAAPRSPDRRTRRGSAAPCRPVPERSWWGRT